jgi:hypothetical protein
LIDHCADERACGEWGECKVERASVLWGCGEREAAEDVPFLGPTDVCIVVKIGQGYREDDERTMDVPPEGKAGFSSLVD